MNPLEQHKSDGDSLDDRLVAYLDGELDADAQDRMERQLAEDAPSRERLRQLQQTWDLLDHLPNAQTDRTFTETTVEMVAAKAFEDVQTQQQTLLNQQRRRWVYGGVWFGASVLLGYMVFYAVSAYRESRMLNDLAVIENIDLYRHVESVSFLRQLDRDGLFGSEELTDEEEWEPARLFTDADTASLRRQARELTSAQKSQLQKQKHRFERLTPEIQDQMRRIHTNVVADANADRLFQVMAQYQEWLTSSLAAEERSQLLALESKERLEKIKRIKGQQDIQRFRSLAEGKMTAKDFEVILDWHQAFVARHRDQAIAKLPEEQRGQWEKLSERMRERNADRGAGFMTPWLLRMLPRPTDGEIEELAEDLSGDAQAALKSATDPDDKAELVQRWVRAAFHSRLRPRVEEDELVRFAKEELDEKQRQELAKMDPKMADQHLRRLYFERHFDRSGPRGGPSRWGPPRGGFGPPDSRESRRGRPSRDRFDGPRGGDRDAESRGRRPPGDRESDRGRNRGRESGGPRPPPPDDGRPPRPRPDHSDQNS